MVGTACSEPVGLTLATKGRSEYVIVVGENAPANEQHAAAELAHFLGKVTGANFKVRPVGKAGAGAKIAVGPAATRTEAISQFERFCSKHKVTRLGEWGSWKRVGWLRERYGQ